MGLMSFNSRSWAFFFMLSRLSCCFLPFARAISILAIPLFVIYNFVGMMVNPFSSDLALNRSISLFLNNNFLSDGIVINWALLINCNIYRSYKNFSTKDDAMGFWRKPSLLILFHFLSAEYQLPIFKDNIIKGCFFIVNKTLSKSSCFFSFQAHSRLGSICQMAKMIYGKCDLRLLPWPHYQYNTQSRYVVIPLILLTWLIWLNIVCGNSSAMAISFMPVFLQQGLVFSQHWNKMFLITANICSVLVNETRGTFRMI